MHRVKTLLINYGIDLTRWLDYAPSYEPHWAAHSLPVLVGALLSASRMHNRGLWSLELLPLWRLPPRLLLSWPLARGLEYWRLGPHVGMV